MKIVLLGKEGQVGWELQRSLAPLGTLIATEQDELDFERPQSLQEWIRRHRPDVIVNAAAYTAVDQAESEPDKARRVNAEAVAVLAEEARRIGAWLVHYSTDYVFDGTKEGSYREDDVPHPLSVYGRTKWEGEETLRRCHPKHLVFRTSWVFASRGKNFARTILKLARERETLSVVADQWGAPTSAELLADVTALALHQTVRQRGDADYAGTYHVAAGGETNWHGYATYVLTLAQDRGVVLKTAPTSIVPIDSNAYPVAAKRPLNSRLDTSKVTKIFGVYLPDWRYHVRRCLDELASQGFL
jgi:dTDP-4-dehydrorhamnose reductase